MEKIFVFEALFVEHKINIKGFVRKKYDEIPIKNYISLPYNTTEIKQLTDSIYDIIDRATIDKNNNSKLLNSLKEQCFALYNSLIPIEIKNNLEEYDGEYLLININDELNFIPWELIYDGNDFWCLKYSCGRFLHSQKKAIDVKIRKLQTPCRMLVISDPANNLPEAYNEGQAIKKRSDDNSNFKIEADLKSGDINKRYFLSKFLNYDIVHIAGHYKISNNVQGWELSDGILESSKLKKLRGTKPFPSLVFSNSCQIANKNEVINSSENIAELLLYSGTRHFIGTNGKVLDSASSKFSSFFYDGLINGKSIGTSLKEARKQILNKYRNDSLIWANYFLYGDPCFTFEDKSTVVKKKSKIFKYILFSFISILLAVVMFLFWNNKNTEIKNSTELKTEFQKEITALIDEKSYDKAINRCSEFSGSNAKLKYSDIEVVEWSQMMLCSLYFERDDRDKFVYNFAKYCEKYPEGKYHDNTISFFERLVKKNGGIDTVGKILNGKCNAITGTGSRCRRNTIYGGYCWQHLDRLFGEK